MEKAIQRMPKSFYLDLLRYKMIFKSRLGRSVVSEMIRFQVGCGAVGLGG